MQEVATSRAKFPKPLKLYEVLAILERTSWFPKERNGRNTERLPLRHSQRYVLSAVCRLFASPIKAERDYQRNNRLVWDETIWIMMDMFNNVWGDKYEVVVDH